MTNRLFHAAALPVALVATGLIVAALWQSPSGRSEVAVAPEAIPVLPLVVVHPDPEIPVLASLTVRPTRAELEAAGIKPAAEETEVASHPRTTVLLPGSGFDMPYYSFGKTQHRVSKE